MRDTYSVVTYSVVVAPGQNDALILAVTVCIDQLANG